MGPAQVPVVSSLEHTRGSVELTLLSGLAHHDSPNVESIGETLWTMLDQQENEYRDLYWDLFLRTISEPARRILMMRLQRYEPQSEWGKKIYAEGHLEGHRAGRLEGHLEAERGALLTLVTARDLSLDPAHRARVDACSDPAQLRAWLRRAATATGADEVFDD